MPVPLITTTSFRAFYFSQSLQDSDMGQTQTMTETWLIEKIPDTGINGLSVNVRITEDDYRAMIVEGAAPHVGARYVDWYPNADMNWMAYATCINRQFDTLEPGKVRATYTWMAPFHTSVKWWKSNPTSTTAVDLAYDIAVDTQTSFRQTELFRQTTTGFTMTVPDPSWTDGYSPADIGGTAVTAGMQGLPYNLKQLRFRVRRMVDLTYIPQQQLVNVFTPYMNTYNSAAFLDGSVIIPDPAGGSTPLTVNFAGYPAGTVLLDGISCVKTDGPYAEIVFEFLHEPYWHFYDQVPITNADGEPKTTVPTTGPWTGTTQLEDVRWRRMTRVSKDHDHVFFDQNTYNGATWTPTESAGYKKLALAGYWQ